MLWIIIAAVVVIAIGCVFIKPKQHKIKNDNLKNLFAEKKEKHFENCQSCGAKIEMENNFEACPYCGAKIIKK